jgi:hypothetical protein
MRVVCLVGLCFALCLLVLVGMLKILREKPSEAEWVAYTLFQSDNEYDVYLMELQNFTSQKIASEVYRDPLGWSSDGVALAFQRRFPVYSACLILMTTHREYCPTRHVTGYRWDQLPSWSPDGQWLTAIYATDEEQVLGRIHRKTGEFYPMLHHDHLWGGATWATDWQGIFFLTLRMMKHI